MATFTFETTPDDDLHLSVWVQAHNDHLKANYEQAKARAGTKGLPMPTYWQGPQDWMEQWFRKQVTAFKGNGEVLTNKVVAAAKRLDTKNETLASLGLSEFAHLVDADLEAVVRSLSPGRLASMKPAHHDRVRQLIGLAE